MSVPVDIFDSLRLSTNQAFSQLDPEYAAAFAQSIRDFYVSDEVKASVMDLGGPALHARLMGLVDVPLNAELITNQRNEARLKDERGLGTQIAEGSAKMIDRVGMAEPITDFVLWLQGMGGSNSAPVPSNAFAPLPDEAVNLPLLGQQTPATLASEIASALPMMIGAVGLGTEAVGATGLAALSPTLASISSYVLGGAGMEAASQVGRNISKGEPFDPANVAIEGAIFGAGGAPVGGGGFFARRAAAAGVSAGAAALAPLAFGRAPSAERVVTEGAFGLLFGNPQMPEKLATPPQVKAVLDTEIPPPPRVERRSPDRLQSDAWVNALRKEAEAPGADPIRAKELKDRAAAVEMLWREVKGDPQKLEALAARPDLNPEQQIMVRDAIVAKRGEILVAPDAPMVKSLPPKEFGAQIIPKADEYLGKLAQRQVDERIFRAPKGDPAFLSDAVVFKALTRGEVLVDGKPLRSGPAKNIMEGMGQNKRMELMLAMEHARETIKQERLGRGAEALGEVDLDLAATKKIGLSVTADEVNWTSNKVYPDDATKLRQLIVDEWKLEEQHIGDQIRVAASDEAPTELRQQLEESLARVQSNSTQSVVPDVATAHRIADNMMDTMSPKEVEKFVGNLPAPLKPFEKEIKAESTNLPTRKADRAEIEAETTQLENAASDRGELVINVRAGDETYLRGDKMRRRTAAGNSLSELQKQAIANDMTITYKQPGSEPGAAGYHVRSGEDEFAFGTMNEAGKFLKYMEDLKAGKRPDTQAGDMELRALAKQKLTVVQHVGAGQYQTVDLVTGKQEVHKNLNAAMVTVGVKETPPGVELVPNVGAGGGGGTIGGPGAEGRYIHFPEVEPDVFPGSTGRALGTQGDLFQRMESATNVPIWSQLWNPLMRASTNRDNFQTPFVNKLHSIFKGIAPMRQRAIQDILIAGSAKGEMGANLKITQKELAAAARLKQWYGSLLGLNTKQLDEFFDVSIPEARKAGGDPTRFRADWTMPGSLAELVDDVFDGKVNLHEPSAGVLAKEIIHAVGRKRFLTPALTQAGEVQNLLRSRLKQTGISPTERKHIITMMSASSDYIDGMVNGISGSTGQGTARVMGTILSEMQKRGLFKQSEMPTVKDVDTWSTEISAYLSGVALSARPALAMRNFFQRMLVGDKVGYGTLLRAQANSFTAEGRKLVAESGAIPEKLVFMLDDIADVIGAADTTIGKIKSGILKAQAWAMKPYKNIESSNRAVSYLAGHQAIKDNAHFILKGHPEYFLVRSGLANEAGFIQKRVLQPLQNVTPDAWDGALKKAGHEYGLILADSSQFIYHRANVPMWMQSIPGRIMGQFGLWPVAYMEYVRRNGLSGAASASSARRLASKRFLARTAVSTAALTTAGAILGIETSTFKFTNPLLFQLGPAAQVVRDAITIGSGGSEFDQRLAKRNVARFFSTFGLPFGGLVQDLGQATQQDDPVSTLLTALGFTLPKKKNEVR